MFLILYHLILLLVLICSLPVLLIKMALQKHYRRGLFERLGFYSKTSATGNGKGPVIWIHGSSVGELQTVLPFLDEIKMNFPGYQLFFSATTMAGVEMLRSRNLRAIYFPLDLYWIAAKAIRRVRPEMIWVLETELWPGFVSAAAKQNIPLVLLNGRISDFSFKRYKLIQLWVQRVLNLFSAVLVQSELDKKRFIELGLEGGKIKVTGNLKFDSAILKIPAKKEIANMRETFAVETSDLILVAGSTHSGEEEILGKIYKNLSKKFHTFRMIIAPRHLTRLKEIQRIFDQLDIPYKLKTKLKKGTARTPVILLDTIGELYKVYSLADIVFIGRSLKNKGGQNPLEAASLSKPVLFGPHMENFRDAARALLQSGGALCVNDAEDLERQIMEWLYQEPARKQSGLNAYKVLSQNAGAADKTWQAVKSLRETVQSQRD